MDTDRYIYDEEAGLWYDRKTGRYVTRQEERRVLDEWLLALALLLLGASRDLRDGSIALAEWQLTMERGIKSAHIVATALAVGGWDRLTPPILSTIAGQVREQYAFLAKFAQQIATGEQRLDGRFLQRVKLYAEAGRGTYENFKLAAAQIAGKQYVRSVRHARDSCKGCLEQEALGWIPVGDSRFIPIGRRNCIWFCKCTLETASLEDLIATGAVAAMMQPNQDAQAQEAV